MVRILILALDGVVDSSLALTLDAASTANRIADARGEPSPIEVTLVCPGQREVRTAAGASYEVMSRVQPRRFDVLIVPGIGLTTPEEVTRFFARPQAQRALAWLRRSAAAVPIVAASCSAVFLLAEAGLLRGRTATTSWWVGAAFRERYPDIPLDESKMTIESSGIITAGAALAQMDLMLHVFARLVGPELSREVARYLAIDHRPSQARYMMLSAVAGLTREVGDIDRWIRANLQRPFSIADMARAHGMSARTLDRRVRAATGRGPLQLVSQIRLEHARHLIETSQMPFEEVAERIGYRDASTLRRLIRRRLRVLPSELRRNARRAS